MVFAHQNFAQVKDNEIINIMVCENYELANQLTRMTYGDDAWAWDCNLYPVSKGDKCIDRVFYFKDGVTPIPRIPTEEERIAALTQENASLTERVTLAESVLNMMIGL
jgi:hypothetical protein